MPKDDIIRQQKNVFEPLNDISSYVRTTLALKAKRTLIKMLQSTPLSLYHISNRQGGSVYSM